MPADRHASLCWGGADVLSLFRPYLAGQALPLQCRCIEWKGTSGGTASFLAALVVSYRGGLLSRPANPSTVRLCQVAV